MATTAKKTTAKKPASKKAGFEVTLELARTTKNTYRFETDDEDSPISTLYVNQTAFSSEPTGVTVVVTPS